MNTKQVTYKQITDGISLAIVELDKHTYACRVEREAQDGEWTIVQACMLEDYIAETRETELAVIAEIEHDFEFYN